MRLKLPRLPQLPPTHAELQIWWQQVVEAIEAQELTQDELIEGLAEVVADLSAAVASILAAQAAADAAQAAADAAAADAAAAAAAAAAAQAEAESRQEFSSVLDDLAGISNGDGLVLRNPDGTFEPLPIGAAAPTDILDRASADVRYAAARNSCMVKKAADQTGANYTVATAIAWDAEVYDDGGWHDNATNNTRLTVPAGISRVRVTGSVRLANAAGGSMTLTLTKNGSSTFDGAVSFELPSTSVPRLFIATGQVPVVAGDYFELQLTYSIDTSIDINAARSNFSIEAC